MSPIAPSATWPSLLARPPGAWVVLPGGPAVTTMSPPNGEACGAGVVRWPAAGPGGAAIARVSAG